MMSLMTPTHFGGSHGPRWEIRSNTVTNKYSFPIKSEIRFERNNFVEKISQLGNGATVRF